MTKEQILEVTSEYRWALEFHGIKKPEKESKYILENCFWMLDKIDEFVAGDRIEKAFRWLGFVQGCFWSTGFRSIEMMRYDNTALIPAETGAEELKEIVA